jgi:imidazole glycerol-phosphate synthase subunit HisH
MKMIAIIDYRAGNLTSVARALQFLKVPCEITSDPGKIERAERVIFPGVGAAGEAMKNLRETGMDACIRRAYDQGKPVLGICLGTQVIFEFSEEDDNTPCLGIVPGCVRHFPERMKANGEDLKIPHMGWNSVKFDTPHPLFSRLPEGAEFYFVHSYYPAPSDEKLIAGRTDYGISFCSALAVGNLVAVQFHPEKSGRFGLEILRNFCNWRGDDAE